MSSRARAVRSYPCKGRLLASKSALMPLEKRPKIDPKWPRPARSSAPWLVVACTLAGNRLATRSGHVAPVYAQFSAPRAILGARGGLRDRWSGPGAHLRGSAALRRHGLHYQRLRQRQRHRVQRWQRPWQSAEGPDLHRQVAHVQAQQPGDRRSDAPTSKRCAHLATARAAVARP